MSPLFLGDLRRVGEYELAWCCLPIPMLRRLCHADLQSVETETELRDGLAAEEDEQGEGSEAAGEKRDDEAHSEPPMTGESGRDERKKAGAACRPMRTHLRPRLSLGV